MEPAFSSPRQLLSFTLFLLLILVAPAVLRKSALPSRDQIYFSVPRQVAEFPYFHLKIFEENRDVDIAFIGSSHLFFGVDAPYVQRKLSKQLGREAVVFSLGYTGPGFDTLYFIARDLLEHRNVRLLVITEEYYPQHNCPQCFAPRLFRYGDNAEDLKGLPLRYRMSYYYAAILGLPKILLSLSRPNQGPDTTSGKKTSLETLYQSVDPALTLGALKVRLGFNYNRDFFDYTPKTPAQPTDACIYSSQTKSSFRFPGPPTPPLGIHFARKLAELAKSRGTKLVVLHLPQITEMKDHHISEREFWPAALGAPECAILGIPPSRLFAGMTEGEVYRLFCDSAHLNKNGQEYFTSLITPRLLEIYDSEAKR